MKPKRRSSKRATSASRRSLKRHAAAARRDRAGKRFAARPPGFEDPGARRAAQPDFASASKPIEQSRQQVLRLLGEASTLRNQLAQIDEYLAAIERDRRGRARKKRSALGDLSRLEQVKIELSEKLMPRQLELESLGDRRRRVEAGNEGAADARHRGEEAHSKSCAPRFRVQKARKDSLEEILSHRAYTTESVKRLFLGLEHGQIEGFKPAGVLADFVEVADPAWEKACEEFLHEELEYVVVQRLERSRARRGVDARRSRRAAPRFWCTRKRDAAFAARARSERGGRASSAVCATLCASPTVSRARRRACCRAWRAASWCPIAPPRNALATAHPDCYLPASGRRQLSRPRGQRRKEDRRAVRWR